MRKKLLLMLMAIVSPLVALAADGDMINVVNEGYTLTFGVYNEDEKACELSCVEPVEGFSGAIVIPETVTNDAGTQYNVIKIGPDILSNREWVTGVSIPKTITIFGQDWENYNPFRECYNLESMTVDPANPKYKMDGNLLIDTERNSVAAGIANGSITIPNGIKQIDLCAFAKCYNLTSVVIPEGVTVIRDNAFYECSNLTSVTIPSSVTSIGGFAFRGCSNLVSIALPETLDYLGWAAFSHTKLSEIEIPTTLSRIEGETFRDTQLTEVTIPKNVIYIAEWAFANAPIQTVTSYVKEPFDINLAFNNDEGALIPTKLKVPTGTTSLYQEKAGWNEFSNIVEIEVPNDFVPGDYLTYTIDEEKKLIFTVSSAKNKTCKLARIDGAYIDAAYSDANPLVKDGLTEDIDLVIPDKVKVGDDDYFTVTEIDDNTFWDASIKSVTLPATLTRIGSYVFGWQTKTVIAKMPTAISVDDYTFQNNQNSKTLYVPAGTKDAYMAADVWKDFQYIFAGNEGTSFTAKTAEGIEMTFTITEDGKECQVGYAQSEAINKAIDQETEGKVTIPEKVTYNGVEYSVTGIGQYAFYNIYRMTEVELPNTLTSISSHAFQESYSLALISSNIEKPFEISEDALLVSQNWNYNEETGTDDVTNVYPAALHVPAGKKADYKATTGWNGFEKYFSGLEGSTFTAATDEGVEVTYTILDEEANECQVGYLNGSWDKTAVERGSFNGKLTIPATATSAGVEYQVTAIGDYALNSIYGMTSVELPSSIQLFGTEALSGGGDLKIVYSYITAPTDIAKMTFAQSWGGDYDGNTNEWSEIDYPNVLYVPAETKELYESKTGWNLFTEIRVIKENVIKFADDAVKNVIINAGYDADGNAVYPDEENGVTVVKPWDADGDGELDTDEAAAITSIGKVFYDNWDITSFDEFKYFTGVTSLENEAFWGGLQSITLPKNLTTIGDNAFPVWNLKNIAVDEESEAFKVEGNILYSKDGKKLILATRAATAGEFKIPDGVSSLAFDAFSGSYDMTSVEFPASVTAIPDGLLSGKDNLETVILPETVTGIGNYAFDNCQKLKQFSLPTSLEYLGDGAFSNCKLFEGTIDIPSSVTSIGSYAFQQTNVTAFNLPETEYPISLNWNALWISDEITPAINAPLSHLGNYALMGNSASLEAGKVVAKVTPVNTMWTLASGVDVILPEGVDAYTCEVVNDTQVGIKKIADEDLIVDDQRVIKANNGVLLKGEASKTYDIVAVPVTKSFGDWIDDYDYKSYGYENQLEPVIYTKSFDASLYYVLSNNAFHPMSNSTENVPAGKAVLYVPGAALSRGVLNITGEDDGTTGINGINADSENGQWYDLQGNRIAAPTKKGLYIKGGKKVIIK